MLIHVLISYPIDSDRVIETLNTTGEAKFCARILDETHPGNFYVCQFYEKNYLTKFRFCYKLLKLLLSNSLYP